MKYMSKLELFHMKYSRAKLMEARNLVKDKIEQLAQTAASQQEDHNKQFSLFVLRNTNTSHSEQATHSHRKCSSKTSSLTYVEIK